MQIGAANAKVCFGRRGDVHQTPTIAPRIGPAQAWSSLHRFENVSRVNDASSITSIAAIEETWSLLSNGFDLFSSKVVPVLLLSVYEM